MTANRYIFFFLIVVMCPLISRSQFVSPYNIGGTIFENSVPAQLNYAFIDTGKCIRLTSGLLLITKKQNLLLFKGSCVENENFAVQCPLIAYPNPVHTVVTIQSGTCYSTYEFLKGSLQIVNESGQLLNSIEIHLEDLRRGLKYDMSKYAAGIYFFRIRFRYEQQTIKIIKT